MAVPSGAGVEQETRAPKSRSPVMSKPARHCEVEKRRKKKISNCIQQLSQHLQPACVCGKQTHGEVLQLVVERVQQLTEENQRLQGRIAMLPSPGAETDLYLKLLEVFVEHVCLRALVLDQRDQCHQSLQGYADHMHTLPVEACSVDSSSAAPGVHTAEAPVALAVGTCDIDRRGTVGWPVGQQVHCPPPPPPPLNSPRHHLHQHCSVWRPYSAESSAGTASGFCLADILSLPPSPSPGGMGQAAPSSGHSFLVNHLLEDL